MATRRNYMDVYQDGKKRLQNNTPVTNFNSQSTAKGYLDILATEMERLYNTAEYLSRSLDPTRALGNNLDNLGFLVGETRSEAASASDYSTTNFFFYIDTRLNWSTKSLIDRNYSEEEKLILETNGYLTRTNNQVSTLKIPQGTVVSSPDKSISYTTTTDVYFNENSTEAYVGVVAGGAGLEYNVGTNVLIAHNLQQISELRKIAQYIKCANRYPIQNGRYSLTDDEYRYRISTSRTTFVTNELSIRRAALSIPGIRDILFEKGRYGNGTFNIIVDGVSPIVSQGLIDAVKEKINQQISYGDVAFVKAPTYLGVEINYTIIVDPANPDPISAKNTSRDVIIKYINNLPIGGEIVWNQLVAAVLRINDIKDFIPNYFKYGEYDTFNKINKNQTVLRFINQSASFDQKWYSDLGLITVCLS